MTLDIAALEAAAEKATPGPWSALSTGVAQGDHWYVTDADEAIAYLSANDVDPDDPRRENAEFIAAANPSVVLELIRRLKAAEEEANRQHEAVELTSLFVLQERARADRAEAKIAKALEITRSSSTPLGVDARWHYDQLLLAIRAALTEED